VGGCCPVGGQSPIGGRSPVGDQSPVGCRAPAVTSLTTELVDSFPAIATGMRLTVPENADVTDTSSLHGTNAQAATGTVTYTLYTNAACTTVWVTDPDVVIATRGVLPPSRLFTLSVTGTYYFQASYSGDADNTPSKSSCGQGGEVLTVTSTPTPPAPTAVSTSLSGGGHTGLTVSVPVQPRTPVTDTATLTGARAALATGTITFYDYANATCTGPPLNGPGGDARKIRYGLVHGISTREALVSDPFTFSAPGIYHFEAVYSGDQVDVASTSQCDEVLTVTGRMPTTLTTSLSGGGRSGPRVSVPVRTPVTDTAVLAGTGAPGAGGTVTYTVYSDPGGRHLVARGGTVGVRGGVVRTSDPVVLAAGTYYWRATYSGDGDDEPSTSPIGSEIEVVVPAPRCPPNGPGDRTRDCVGARGPGFGG